MDQAINLGLGSLGDAWLHMPGVDDRDPGKAVEIRAPVGAIHPSAGRALDYYRLDGLDDARVHILRMLLYGVHRVPLLLQPFPNNL